MLFIRFNKNTYTLYFWGKIEVKITKDMFWMYVLPMLLGSVLACLVIAIMFMAFSGKYLDAFCCLVVIYTLVVVWFEVSNILYLDEINTEKK